MCSRSLGSGVAETFLMVNTMTVGTSPFLNPSTHPIPCATDFWKCRRAEWEAGFEQSKKFISLRGSILQLRDQAIHGRREKECLELRLHPQTAKGHVLEPTSWTTCSVTTTLKTGSKEGHLPEMVS